MRRSLGSRAAAGLCLFGLCLSALCAYVPQAVAAPPAGHAEAEHGKPAAHDEKPHGAGHATAEHAGGSAHGGSAHDGSAHDGSAHDGSAHDGSAHDGKGAHGGHGDPQINWFHGLLGEKEGVEPSLLWRSPGTPPPYASMALNTLVLGFVLFKLAKGPVVNGLRTRRERLLKGIDEASRMKSEAERSLAEYRRKLDNIDSEIERVRQEMRQSSEAERQRILAEAEQRRERLENEARLLIEQELSAVHEQLRRETAAAALRSAREMLRTQTTGEDQRRLCDAFLQDLRLRSQTGIGPSNGGTHS